MSKTILPALLALMLGCVPALAADADADAGLQAVMDELKAVKAARASFTERKYMGMLDQPLETSGTLTYTAPDRVEKDTTAPAPEHFAVDGDSVTVRRGGDTHTLSIAQYPRLAAFVESVRATLAGDLPTLKRYYDVGFTGDAKNWQMSLRPRDQKMRDLVTWIGLAGSGAALREVDMLEADGDKSEMTITAAAP